MIDNYFREHLPKATKVIIRFYSFTGVSPNQVTCAGFILSLASAYLVSVHAFLPALAMWWLSRLLDGTDGIYARETNQTSNFGAFLDILLDMSSYSVMVIGFYLAFPQLQLAWLIIVFLYVLCITGALALGSFEDKIPSLKPDNRGLRLAAGVAEGGETGLAYSTFLLFPDFIDALSNIWIGILLFTVVARVLLAKKELKL
jgi:phosphatidylglycerophosphate synthase